MFQLTSFNTYKINLIMPKKLLCIIVDQPTFFDVYKKNTGYGFFENGSGKDSMGINRLVVAQIGQFGI
jgi:hypothetical protein